MAWSVAECHSIHHKLHFNQNSQSNRPLNTIIVLGGEKMLGVAMYTLNQNTYGKGNEQGSDSSGNRP